MIPQINERNLMPKHQKYIILSTLGVSFIAFAFFGSDDPLPYWGILAIIALGIGCGLAAYGFTSLLVEYRQSKNWQELRNTFVEKFKQAYGKKK